LPFGPRASPCVHQHAVDFGVDQIDPSKATHQHGNAQPADSGANVGKGTPQKPAPPFTYNIEEAIKALEATGKTADKLTREEADAIHEAAGRPKHLIYA
jgi:hypothetical protein